MERRGAALLAGSSFENGIYSTSSGETKGQSFEQAAKTRAGRKDEKDGQTRNATLTKVDGAIPYRIGCVGSFYVHAAAVRRHVPGSK